MEEWRDVPFEDFSSKYEVSNLGRVRTKKTGYILTPFLSGPRRHGRRQYQYVTMQKCGGGQGNKSVHRMVALAFLELVAGKVEVNHINGVKSDNAAVNLEWASASENIQHAVDRGLIPSGERRRDAKLNANEVRLVRQLIKFGACPQEEIASAFCVSQSLVSRIKHGKCWKQLPA